MIALGNPEVVDAGNEDQHPVVADCQEVAHERRKLLAALAEGKAHGHHVEVALGQHSSSVGTPYEQAQKLAPVKTLV